MANENSIMMMSVCIYGYGNDDNYDDDGGGSNGERFKAFERLKWIIMLKAPINSFRNNGKLHSFDVTIRNWFSFHTYHNVSFTPYFLILSAQIFPLIWIAENWIVLWNLRLIKFATTKEDPPLNRERI